MPHIIFVGTSHIAAQSVKQIKKAFLDNKPDIVAIELDNQRLHALLSEQKPSYSLAMIPKIGLQGYLFATIGGLLQRKLGRMVGMQPGADMKQAATLAKNNQKPILLLDQEITKTLKKLSKTITRKEKWRFFTDLFFGWTKKQPKIKINLKNVPEQELITKLMLQLKDRYPSFYNVLVHDRNVYMAKKLSMAAMQHPDKTFLVVVGAGHLQGLRQEFQNTITTLLNQQTKKSNDERAQKSQKDNT